MGVLTSGAYDGEGLRDDLAVVGDDFRFRFFCVVTFPITAWLYLHGNQQVFTKYIAVGRMVS